MQPVPARWRRSIWARRDLRAPWTWEAKVRNLRRFKEWLRTNWVAPSACLGVACGRERAKLIVTQEANQGPVAEDFHTECYDFWAWV